MKLLDIGGRPVAGPGSDGTSQPEVPPIPAHVHMGDIVNGHPTRRGKAEAYFFPPVDHVITITDRPVTRLGVRPGVTQSQVLAALGEFACSDRMYGLLNEFPIQPGEGWTIVPGVIHAPGPWPTLEMQRPQDDFNLFAWQMGSHVPDALERAKLKEEVVCRGLPSDAACVEELLDWPLTSASDFQARFKRLPKLLRSETWGTQHQVFFDIFYGESLKVVRGQSATRCESKGRAFSAVVWTGRGFINGLFVDASRGDLRELVAPGKVCGACVRMRICV